MLPELAGLPVYELCAGLAASLGVLLAARALGKLGLSGRRIAGLLALLAIAFLIGARLWNVMVAPGNYNGSLHWYSLRLAGFSLYGGLLMALAALLIVARIWRQVPWPWLDALTVPGGAAFCVMRLGCFCAGCCGGKITDGPLGVVFPSHQAAGEALAEIWPFLAEGASVQAVYPTQLFELALAALGLPLAVWLAGCREPAAGGRFLLYMIWFCAMRLAILPFRAIAGAAWAAAWLYPLLYLVLIAAALIILLRRRQKHDEA